LLPRRKCLDAATSQSRRALAAMPDSEFLKKNYRKNCYLIGYQRVNVFVSLVAARSASGNFNLYDKTPHIITARILHLHIKKNLLEICHRRRALIPTRLSIFAEQKYYFFSINKHLKNFFYLHCKSNFYSSLPPSPNHPEARW